ncbi:unnamed protein product [Clavelina lepadiformis]|uniref:SWIM-type domain-containing protein n=1 Tax=Clavelina lepadiformis TaxID=159417 RepID=A0ABP0GA91_CLALP
MPLNVNNVDSFITWNLFGAVLCSAGPRFFFSCLSWESLMDSMNVLPYTNFHVKYGDVNVKCYTKISFNNLELNYNCNCRDVSTERSQTCHFRRSSSGSCEHALSFLVRDMNKIDPARYPVPCDPENMEKECERSLT